MRKDRGEDWRRKIRAGTHRVSTHSIMAQRRDVRGVPEEDKQNRDTGGRLQDKKIKRKKEEEGRRWEEVRISKSRRK